MVMATGAHAVRISSTTTVMVMATGAQVTKKANGDGEIQKLIKECETRPNKHPRFMFIMIFSTLEKEE